jgi:hypothetical protein
LLYFAPGVVLDDPPGPPRNPINDPQPAYGTLAFYVLLLIALVVSLVVLIDRMSPLR